jgi:hypothetical protein
MPISTNVSVLIFFRRFSGNMRCSNTWLSQNIVDGWGPESISMTSPIPGSYQYSISAPCQPSIIKSAFWHTLNVTQAVRDMVLISCSQRSDTLQFFGNYSSLFGDPASGVIKTMKVLFSDGNEWSGIEGLPATVQLPQLDLSKSRFTATFYGATSEPLVFIPEDIFIGNSILAFSFTIRDSGAIEISHISSSIKSYQDMARISARLIPSASRNLRSIPFLVSEIPSRIAIHSAVANTIPTSGSVSLTLVGHQFSALAVSSFVRLSASSVELSVWVSDSLVSCKAPATARSFDSILLSVNSQVALSMTDVHLGNASVSSLRYTSSFAFHNHETSSVLSGQNFGTSPSDEKRLPVSLYINNIVCSGSKWVSDSSIICESSPAPFQASHANVTVMISSERSSLVPQSITPIDVQFQNLHALCSVEHDTSTASSGLASVILKSCRGRTIVFDHRSDVVPIFPSLLRFSSQYQKVYMIRYVRFQGRGGQSGLQISHVSVMSAERVNLAQNKQVSSSISVNSSVLSMVVNGLAEARAYSGVWEGTSGSDWLEIDLAAEYAVSQIIYYNRLDCCQLNAKDALLTLMDASRSVIEVASLNSELVQTFNFNSSCAQPETGSFSCSCGTGFSEIGLQLIDVEQCSKSPGVHVFNSTRSCSVFKNATREFTCSCNGHPGNSNSYRIACGCSADGLFSCSCAGSSSWNDPEFNSCNLHSIYQELPGLDLCSSSGHNCSTSGGICQMSGLNSFNCSCIAGYRGDGYTCIDVDECSENSHNCGNGATCMNTVGSFSCVVDFCGLGNNCSSMAACSNSASSFTCTCKPGFQGNGHVCTDIDECASNIHNCWSPLESTLQTQDPVESCRYAAVGSIDCLSSLALQSAFCINSVGSYSCHCPIGFSGDGRSCRDIDECQMGISNCSSPHSNAFCINTIGSYECQCKTGYSGPLTLKTCPEGAIRLYTQEECAALQGIFYSNGECLKPQGGSFSFDNRPQCLACSDINECTPGRNTCPANSVCSNSAGGHRCICNEGFTGDGKTCWDINECSMNTHNCSASHKCVNTNGSFRCQCIGPDCFGFAGDCELNPSMCGPNGICNITEFGTFCSCRNGYIQMEGYSGVKCDGVRDPLCWTHAATKVETSPVLSSILSASSIAMSDDSRYALAAQSSGFVFLSVLPLSEIRVFSELSDHVVSFYVDGVFSEFTTTQTTLKTFLNPNIRHVLAIETVSFNSFAVTVDNLPCRASQWRCTVTSTIPADWKHPDFDDSAWPTGTSTSYIAAASLSNPVFSGIHQSSQWIGFVSASASVPQSVSSRISSPKIVVSDSFQNSTLNSNFWTFVPSGGSFQVGNGFLVLVRNPIIRSTIQFDSSMFPISVSGTFKFDYSSDFLRIYTRSHATPFGSSREVNGLCFFIGTGTWPDGQASQYIDDSGIQRPNPLYVAPSERLTMSISMRISETQFIGSNATKKLSSWRAIVGITYSFRVVDSGSFAQIFINDTLQLTLSNISHSSILGNYVAFL